MSNQPYEQTMEQSNEEPDSGSMEMPSDCDDLDFADDGGDVVMCSMQDRFNLWRESYSGSEDNEGVLMELFLDEQIASMDPNEQVEMERSRIAMLENESLTSSRHETVLETSSQSVQESVDRPVIPITQSVNSALGRPTHQSSFHPRDQVTSQHVSQPVVVPVDQSVSQPVSVPVHASRPPIPHYPPYAPRTFPPNRRFPNIPDHPTVFLLRGVSGSGKSTIAKKLMNAVHKKLKHSKSPATSQSSNQSRHSANYDDSDYHPERSASDFVHQLTEDSKNYYLYPETDSFVYVGPPKVQPKPVRSAQHSNIPSPSHSDVVAICSADDYFVKANGDYNFDARYLSRAHNDCMGKVLAAIDQSVSYIIIDNTHSEKWEYANYQTLAKMFKYELIVIEMVIEDHACLSACVQRASHGVQWSITLNLFNRWQTDENAIKLTPQWSPADKEHILRHDYAEYQKAKQKFIAREQRKLLEQLWNNQINNSVNNQLNNQPSNIQSFDETVSNNPMSIQSSHPVTNPRLSNQSSRHHIRPKHVVFNDQSDRSHDPSHILPIDQPRTQSRTQPHVHSAYVPSRVTRRSSAFAVRLLRNDAANASQHHQNDQSHNESFDDSADMSDNRTRLRHKRPHSPRAESGRTNDSVDQSDSGLSDHQPRFPLRQPLDRSNNHRGQSNNQQNNRSNGRASNQSRSEQPRRPRNQPDTRSNDQINSRFSNQSFPHSINQHENQVERNWNRQNQHRQQRPVAQSNYDQHENRSRYNNRSTRESNDQSNNQPVTQHSATSNKMRFVPRAL